MNKIIDNAPFLELDTRLHESEFDDYPKVLGLSTADTLVALDILRLLTTGFGLSRDPHPAFSTQGTYPQCLRVAKRISEITLSDVPVIGNAFNTKPPILVNAQTDIEPIWQDALQDDQESYYLALQQHKAHQGEEGWDWTTKNTGQLLDALDYYYDLSNNMEGISSSGQEEA